MKKKVAMFPGQGSAYTGIGKTLCENHEIARRTFEEASDALSMDLKKLCFLADIHELAKTEISQPATLTASVAAYRVLCETAGFTPHFMAGHSLGEFSALTCANAIEFADAVKLVRKRGLLMRDAAGPDAGLMTAVGKLPKEMISNICNDVSGDETVVCISNYNAPKQNVISGHKEAVSRAEKELVNFGATVKRLNVSAPFHSPLMQPAIKEFSHVLKSCAFNEPDVPVISNVTARPHVYDEIAEKMALQLISPVRWQETVTYLKDESIGLAVDVGPGKILRNLMRDNFPNVKTLAYDVPDDSIELEKILQNDKPIAFISRCMGLAVSAKNLCTDKREYEEKVVKPYLCLQSMQETIEQDGRNATEEEMRQAREFLIGIFDAKGLSKHEKKQRLSRLYMDTQTENKLG